MLRQCMHYTLVVGKAHITEMFKVFNKHCITNIFEPPSREFNVQNILHQTSLKQDISFKIMPRL